MKITIIGVGTMGTIFQNALKEKNGFDEADILLIDRNDETKLGDVVLFAVKPQDFEEAAKRLKGVEGKLIISIMAGVTIAKIKRLAPGNRIVRSMPNLGALSSKSMTIWKTDNLVTSKEKELIKKIFSSIGEELEVKSEELIDSATAISGSGPGYIYFIAGEMQKVAQKLGFNKTEAERMIKQTFLGAVEVWKGSDLSVDMLESKVKSPKGTTEAGIKEFKENHLGKVIEKGMAKARKRAKELSKI